MTCGEADGDREFLSANLPLPPTIGAGAKDNGGYDNVSILVRVLKPFRFSHRRFACSAGSTRRRETMAKLVLSTGG
jgi:hypothetical protein